MIELSSLLLFVSLAGAVDANGGSPAVIGEEHELTGRERRRARREERRRLRRERRQGHGDGSADENGMISADQDVESEEQQEQQIQKGMDKAGGNAQKLGDMLKKSLNTNPEDMPMGKSLSQALSNSLGGRSGGGGSSSGGGGGGGSGSGPVSAGEQHVKEIHIPNIAKPDAKNKQDLLAAVRSGFAESLTATGLKLGTGSDGKTTIVSQDGSMAGQNQLDALAQHIGNEPSALTKRPDFHKVLSREKFKDLKQDIKKSELSATVFKHVATSQQQRDIVYSQSCGGVSGGCNSYVSRGSYQSGDYVEPEDLGQLWKAARQEGPEERGDTVQVRERPVNAKSIRSKLNVVLGAIKQVFVDTKGQKSGGASGMPGGSGGSSVGGVFLGMFDWGKKSDKEIVYTDVQRKGQAVVPGKNETALATPVSTHVPPDKVPAAGMGLGLAVVGLAALAFKRALG